MTVIRADPGDPSHRAGLWRTACFVIAAVSSTEMIHHEEHEDHENNA
jgi:hypothetical protein